MYNRKISPSTTRIIELETSSFPRARCPGQSRPHAHCLPAIREQRVAGRGAYGHPLTKVSLMPAFHRWSHTDTPVHCVSPCLPGKVTKPTHCPDRNRPARPRPTTLKIGPIGAQAFFVVNRCTHTHTHTHTLSRHAPVAANKGHFSCGVHGFKSHTSGRIIPCWKDKSL